VQAVACFVVEITQNSGNTLIRIWHDMIRFGIVCRTINVLTIPNLQHSFKKQASK
jgi:hypothetical protein